MPAISETNLRRKFKFGIQLDVAKFYLTARSSLWEHWLGTVRFFWSELGDFAVLLRRLVKLKIHKQWQLEGHSVERMYLRHSCSDGSR